MESSELLQQVDGVLRSEGMDSANNSKMTPLEKLEKLIIPAFESSKNVQSSLYAYQPTPGSGLVRRIKNKLLTKVRNVTIAVLERTIMRQQKVNELAYQAIIELKEELKVLKSKQS